MHHPREVGDSVRYRDPGPISAPPAAPSRRDEHLESASISIIVSCNVLPYDADSEEDRPRLLLPWMIVDAMSVVFGFATGSPWLIGVAMLMFAPVLLLPGGSPTTGPSEDGGGSGEPGDGPPPTKPIGGPPLPDAEQSTQRMRDHDRDRSSGDPQRRRVREPGRTTVPVA